MTPWEQFKKLRSHLCETCHHAFEHHGTRMTGPPAKNFFPVSGVPGTCGLKRKRQP